MSPGRARCGPNMGQYRPMWVRPGRYGLMSWDALCALMMLFSLAMLGLHIAKLLKPRRQADGPILSGAQRLVQQCAKVA